MDKLTIKRYCRYSKIEFDINEEDIKVKSSDNKLTESELNDLMLLNLIHCIKSKFDSEELYLYRKIRIHGTLYKLEDIKIYFSNKLELCKGKEKVNDWSSLITFLAGGIAILLSLVTTGSNIIKDTEGKFLTFASCLGIVFILSWILYYFVGKLKENSYNSIRIECGFYELVLNILNEN